MRDFKLDLQILELQGAKFVSIPHGLKSPKHNDWHKTPLTLQQIDIKKDNIGIMLTEKSNGIVAIDFDGMSSIDYYYKLFNIDIPDTVAFTSTREGRHQRLFKINSEYFQYLSLKQLKTGTVGSDKKAEQLELRFQYEKAAQSVLPPSIVTDDLGTRQYQYLPNLSPQDIEIAELPEEILVHWLLLCNDIEEKKEIDYSIVIDHNEDMIVHLAETLKFYYPTLSYDEWIRVSWAFKNSVGEYDSLSIMQYFWPEEKKGEYKKLMRSKPNGKKCTLGTIRHMIKMKGGSCANNEDEILLCKILNEKGPKN